MLVDLLHLSRNLGRSRASAFAAVLTLSLTLGAGASIFAVVDEVLLTPPPFKSPGALVNVGEAPLDEPAAVRRAVSYATFAAWRERAGSRATIEAFDGTNLTLTELGPAERVSATDATAGFLPLLGVVSARGRLLDPSDAGRPRVMVSHAFWRGRLAADPDVIGREVILGGQAHTIVGVLPERFFFALNPCDIWRLAPITPPGYRVNVIARLALSVSSESLGDMLDDVSRRSSPPARAVATPIAAAIAGEATRTLGLLAASAALATLVAFTNLAGLLVVRSINRRRELAIRTALGARQSEIARQLVLEAEALVVMGIVGGVLLALWMTPAVGRVALEQFGRVANREVAVSWRVIVAVAGVAAACAAVCGLLPALLVAQRDVVGVLRRGATPPPRELTMRRAFVAGEVALAFVLLVSLATLGRSLLGLLEVNPGFEADGVLTMSVSLPVARYTSDQRVASFYVALQDALDHRLGPRTAAIIDELPLTGDRGRSLVGVRSTDVGQEAVMRVAGTGYFTVMRIPVVAGRSFDEHDNTEHVNGPAAAVVSASLAERLFGTESPIGRQIWVAATAQTAEVIGVVGDVRHRALDESPSQTVYLSAWQAPSPSSHVVARSAVSDADVITAVRDEVARLDRDLPVYDVRSMQDVVAASPGVPARRVLTASFMAFALLAVVLGAVGLFGVVAHDVASRRAEIALRIALGADPMRILGATVRQGAWLVGLGLALGGVLSIWAGRAISSAMSATDHLDVLSVGMAAAVLLAVGAGAVLPAARRAARTDPLIALRGE